MEVIENFEVKLTFQTVVDTETGEITTKCIKKNIDKLVNLVDDKKKKKKDENPIPTLTVEDNKYTLNTAAVELMGVEPNDTLDIKYEQKNKVIIPVIGKDESFGTHNGNRLTKSYTVACRGNKHNELVKYGTEFTVIPHNEKVGIFILQGKNSDIKKEEVDEEDFDLESLLGEDVTEVSPSIFKL